MNGRRSLRLIASLASAAPLALAALVTAGAAPGCYGATEIQVEVTTNVSCLPGATLTTQIYTGATGTTDFGTAAAAETDRCGPTEPRVGTLSIVPASGRDDRFDIEVVGAVGVQIGDCRAIMSATASPGAVAAPTPTGCIVARRRVSFRPHKALTLPILLDKSCIGVPCGSDETCDVGICTPTSLCDETGCPRERVDGGAPPTPVADASPDAVDSGSDADASSGRCGATPALVADDPAIQGQLVLDNDDLVYLRVTGTVGVGQGELRRVSRTSGAARSAGASGDRVYAFAYNTTATGLVASPDGTGLAKIVVGRNDSTGAVVTSVMADPISITFSGTTAVGFLSSAASGTTSAFSIANAGSTASVVIDGQNVGGPVPEIVVDVDGDIYGVAATATLVHDTVASGVLTPAPSATLGLAASDLAVANGIVFVAATALGSSHGIFRIPRADIATWSNAFTPWLPLTGHPLPQSMASDGVSLYYVIGTALFRADVASAMPAATQIGTTGAQADRLLVDDQCVYWVEDGGRIMKQRK